MNFGLVLTGQGSLGQVVNEVADEGAGSWIEDVHAVIGQGTVEVLVQQIIHTLQHEMHDFAGGIHHAEAVWESSNRMLLSG